MDLKVKVSSLLTILIIASTAKSQCTLNSDDLLDHLLIEQVFSNDITAEVRDETGTHRLVVQWKLIHPACWERVCVDFPSGGISEYCLSSTLSTEASIPDLPCNRNIQVRVRASGHNVRRISSTLTIYIGGNPGSPPSAPPHNVFARQIRTDPYRIEMGWEPVTCLQQNSPITDYRVHYGRINTTEVRTVTTKDTRIFSEISNANNGLGILQIGEEYWFRVAARNADGQGPFSATFRAMPLPFISDPPPPPPTTMPPPSTAPPTTTPSPPPPITTSQLPATTIKLPEIIAETHPKVTTTTPSIFTLDAGQLVGILILCLVSVLLFITIVILLVTCLILKHRNRSKEQGTYPPNTGSIENHSSMNTGSASISIGQSPHLYMSGSENQLPHRSHSSSQASSPHYSSPSIHSEARLLLNARIPTQVDTSRCSSESLTCTPNCAYNRMQDIIGGTNAQIQTRNPVSSSRQISVQYDYPELRFTADHSNENMELSDTYDVITTMTRNK